mgnify:CR=1 FL=1
MTSPLNPTSKALIDPITFGTENPIVASPPTTFESSHPDSLNDMEKLANEIMVFIEEISRLPNFYQELPLDKLNRMQELTEKAHRSLGLHPCFNLDEAKKIVIQMKEDLSLIENHLNDMRSNFFGNDSGEIAGEFKNFDLSSLVFDCGGFIKRMEGQRNVLRRCIPDLDKIILFQEDSKAKLSDEIKFPLLVVFASMKRILESGLFK